MRRIKVVDSSELAVAKFLIYLFIWGPFTVKFISQIYGTYKKEIVKENKKPLSRIETLPKYNNF